MEKSSNEPLPAISLPLTADIVPRAEAVAAVRANGVAVEGYLYWRRLIRERIALHYKRYFPLGPQEDEDVVRQAHLERLLDFENFAGLSDIWLSSPFVKETELAAAGQRRKKVLTRQSISRRLHALAERTQESADMSAYEARATRLVEAMLSFGLLEEECARANLKPLRATPLLHALMMAYHTNLNLLWSWAVDGAEAETPCSRTEASND